MSRLALGVVTNEQQVGEKSSCRKPEVSLIEALWAVFKFVEDVGSGEVALEPDLLAAKALAIVGNQCAKAIYGLKVYRDLERGTNRKVRLKKAKLSRSG